MRDDRGLGERNEGSGQPVLELYGDYERVVGRVAVLGRGDVLTVGAGPAGGVQLVCASDQLPGRGRHRQPVSEAGTSGAKALMRLRAVGIGLVLAAVCVGLKLQSVASRTTTPPRHGRTRTASVTGASAVNECATPRVGWIWCDDFEEDRLRQYFEYDSAGGSFVRAAGVGRDGSFGMRARFARGQTSAGGGGPPPRRGAAR